MTMRTRTKLICACGHTGYHEHAENDQPYSASWDNYSLNGFAGGGEKCDDLASITCNNCRQTGTVRRAGGAAA